MKNSILKGLSGALLVAGTSIGAGMLALPVATALGGFLPACIVYFFCWLFMATTGLLLLEVCLWMPEDANIVSMAKHLLGKGGQWLSWILYLYLFYCLMIAYSAGGGSFIGAAIERINPLWKVPQGGAILLFVLLFSPIVFIGARAVNRLNAILMVGLVAAYLGFVYAGWSHVEPTKLYQADWWQGILALPIVFTSFSYQGIVPSLNSYLKRHAKLVRGSILLGTALPFVIYVIWEFLILGIVPIEGQNGLLEARMLGRSAVAPLHHFIDSPYISALGQAFAFFALTTSFLGVGLGLTDFLADGLRIAKKGVLRFYLSVIVFFPPLMIAMINPNIFLQALTYAGGYGCALLLGLLPIVMVWVGRYRKGYMSQVQLFGGRGMLALLAFFVLFELMIQLQTQ